MTRVLKGKTVVLGVTGGIAAYKVVELASSLVQAGALVEVVMTPAAKEFVAPLTFQAITHRPVIHDMFSPLLTRLRMPLEEHGTLTKYQHAQAGYQETAIDHVALAKRADLLVIAPATANTIAKLAVGLADNVLTATALDTAAPIIIAPAMETGMYQNPVTQENLTRLRERGAVIVEPGYGRLASGSVGVGRLAEIEEILGTIRSVLGREGDLAGKRIVVTAGGTQEPIDPVRFIGNRSSGKMGYALAEAARDRGAGVTLISGPTALSRPVGVQHVPVGTAREMRDAVLEAIPEADALIMAAAVADYRPASPLERKIKKRGESLTLELVPTSDILAEVAQWRLDASARLDRAEGRLKHQARRADASSDESARLDLAKSWLDLQARRADSSSPLAPLVVVGFAAETENLIQNARAKLVEKGLDLIVANPVPESFGSDSSQVTLIDREGTVTEMPLLPKNEVAERVLDRVVELLGERDGIG